MHTLYLNELLCLSIAIASIASMVKKKQNQKDLAMRDQDAGVTDKK